MSHLTAAEATAVARSHDVTLEEVFDDYGVTLLSGTTLTVHFIDEDGRSLTSRDLVGATDPTHLRVRYQVGTTKLPGPVQPVPSDLVPLTAAITWTQAVKDVAEFSLEMPNLEQLSTSALFKLASTTVVSSDLVLSAYTAIVTAHHDALVRRNTRALALRSWLGRNSIPFVPDPDRPFLSRVAVKDVPSHLLVSVYALMPLPALLVSSGELNRALKAFLGLTYTLPTSGEFEQRVLAGDPSAASELEADLRARDADVVAWVAAGSNREVRRRRALGVDPHQLEDQLLGDVESWAGAPAPAEPLPSALWLYANRGRVTEDVTKEVAGALAHHERVLLTQVQGPARDFFVHLALRSTSR